MCHLQNISHKVKNNILKGKNYCNIFIARKNIAIYVLQGKNIAIYLFGRDKYCNNLFLKIFSAIILQYFIANPCSRLFNIKSNITRLETATAYLG